MELKKNEQKKEEKDIRENKEYTFSEEEELKACRYCRTMISKTAKVCPNCQKRLRKNWLGIFVLLCLLAACAAGGYYYMTVYSVTEQVSSVEAVAETGQNTGDGETPAEGLSAENAVETVDMETEAAVSAAELPALPEVLESAEASETEPEKETKADKEGGPEKEAEADKEGGPEKEAEADKEGGPEKEAEADKEGGPEKKAEADKEGEPEEASGIGKEGEPEKEAEANEERELEKGFEVGKAGEPEKEMEAEKKEEVNEGMATADDHAEALEPDAITGYTEEAFRDICSQVDYKKLLRSQESYLNAAVTEELTVVEQVDGGLFDENVYYLCRREDEQGITRYYIIRDDREDDVTPILEGDVLQIYGQLFGSCKLPGYLVKIQPVVPALTMVYYDILEE